MQAQAEERRLGRYAAPALFLLAVTVAVLVLRGGLGGHGTTSTTTTATTAKRAPVHAASAPAARYYVVHHGDTFGAIAAKSQTSVAALERLNPGVSSNALHVGERIRVK